MTPSALFRPLAAALLFALAAPAAADQPAAAAVDKPATLADVLAAASDGDWRRPDPENTLYLEIAGGRVVIELAPQFAPEHVANLRTLARAGYWDGLAILRVQDNYVVQWGDPDADDADQRRPLGDARERLPAEFSLIAPELPFTALDGGDLYAPQAGWVDGFPAARNPADGQTWMAHCYGLVGAGRDNAADSSNGTQLYVVIGHAPRHLDRNITSVGRVLKGIEHLSSLPRGGGVMGFHQHREDMPVIQRIRLAADVAQAERSRIEVFRTDTPAFARLIEARRHRHEEWFVSPVGKIELCNVPIPVREG